MLPGTYIIKFLQRGYLSHTGSLRIIFPVFAADVCGLHFVHQLKCAVLLVVELHRAPAVAAVPQAIVPLAAVGGFVIYQQHVCFPAEDLRLHSRVNVLLTNRPVHHVVELLKGEVCLDLQMELGEIEIVLPALVVEYTQQAAIQRHEVDLRPAAADIEHAVHVSLC